jgi:hypothetical protein
MPFKSREKIFTDNPGTRVDTFEVLGLETSMGSEWNIKARF